jgi:hypothetical protein
MQVGLGQTDELKTTAQTESAKGYYQDLGTFARTSNSTISVIGIEGSNCGLVFLGECAAQTQGTCTIARPIELVRQIRTLYQNTVIASSASVSVFLPRGLAFHSNEEWKKREKSAHGLVKLIGNVTHESDLSFEMQPATSGAPSAPVTIQAQISYVRPDGWQCLRTFTYKLQVTKDRAVAEKAANIAVVGLVAVQQAALIAKV